MTHTELTTWLERLRVGDFLDHGHRRAVRSEGGWDIFAIVRYPDGEVNQSETVCVNTRTYTTAAGCARRVQHDNRLEDSR